MNNSIKKIFTTMDSIGFLPKRIIMHGVQLATGLLLIALTLHFINNNIYHFDYNINIIMFAMAKTGLVIFAEAVIGGLVVDYLSKKA
ncbi:hypothetical protein [Petroclostridium sp. X23]|jgi:hypothetical protein|uniref:hypothetical protein n=1 Tax=Petroclostridium sp. X23 TaxID=3045146 RepID=UPI0024AD7FF3|nr:hypothetical protein [Petroclostridium sp. X23]WHH59056.1 hypothetical protein QKW49_25260 [Petroclostridium sp. X23]